jgi:hypothetical protein
MGIGRVGDQKSLVWLRGMGVEQGGGKGIKKANSL